MYIEGYCPFKKENIVLNECNMSCICAMCNNEKCMERIDTGAAYKYSICQEYITYKIDAEYKHEKRRQCRMCLEIGRKHFAQKQK